MSETYRQCSMPAARTADENGTEQADDGVEAELDGNCRALVLLVTSV